MPTKLKRLSIAERLMALAIGDRVTLGFRPCAVEVERFRGIVLDQLPHATIISLDDWPDDLPFGHPLRRAGEIAIYHDTCTSPGGVWHVAVLPCQPDELPPTPEVSHV